ncbi:hypothetical protein D3C80_1384890 [compost metagenome]
MLGDDTRLVGPEIFLDDADCVFTTNIEVSWLDCSSLGRFRIVCHQRERWDRLCSTNSSTDGVQRDVDRFCGNRVEDRCCCQILKRLALVVLSNRETISVINDETSVIGGINANLRAIRDWLDNRTLSVGGYEYTGLFSPTSTSPHFHSSVDDVEPVMVYFW